MSTIDVTNEVQVQTGTFANRWYVHAQHRPKANLADGDRILLAKLDAGTKLLDAQAFIEDALASLTFSLGFDYINGEAGDDEAYFFNAADVAAGGRFRADQNKPPLILQYDAYLVATLAGAAFPTTNKLDVVGDYDYLGPVTQPS